MMRVLVLLLGLCMTAAPAAVDAQDTGNRAAAKGRSKPVPNKAPKSKRVKQQQQKTSKARSKSAPARGPAPDKPAEPTKPAEAAAPGRAPSVDDAAALAADADEAVRKEGGSEIKTVEFGGLDIEGQLKTPQMLYFLNRLRAEFSRPELPHRSFIPELQRGTKESAF